MKINVEPWVVVKEVYDMCVPVGMGILQFENGDMSEDDAKAFVAKYPEKAGKVFVGKLDQ